MFDFLKKLWIRITGIFLEAGDDVVSGSPSAVKATYRAAIHKAKNEYQIMFDAVAQLAAQRERTIAELQKIDGEEIQLKQNLEGALVAAEKDPENIKHKQAGERYIKRLDEINLRQDQLNKDLEVQTSKVEEYKLKLTRFQEEIKNLEREMGESVADFISSQQIVQLENRLQGLGQSVEDEAIVAIREKIAKMKAKAKIASELGHTNVEIQDREYAQMGKEKIASTKFEELLKQRQEKAAEIKEAEEKRDLG
ncbi:MAG: hypothetical protein JXA60_01150 [Candidatus Coatesbacteria bacterium]|nr:hypothetical protein [Candidatus Coatesbacteria bacterium]